jgi:glycosyltransferase involved in cell wall biosynthesis
LLVNIFTISEYTIEFYHNRSYNLKYPTFVKESYHIFELLQFVWKLQTVRNPTSLRSWKSGQTNIHKSDKIAIYVRLSKKIKVTINKNKMKIAFITNFDLQKQPSSRIGRWLSIKRIAQSLEKAGIEVIYIDGLKETQWPRHWTIRLKSFIYSKLGQRYLPEMNERILRDYAKQVEVKLSQENCDLILCPHNIKPITYLKAKQSIILWQDAPFYSLVDTYMKNLCQETKNSIYIAEDIAYKKCSKIFFSSDWAISEVKKFWQIPLSSLGMLPYGANFESGLDSDEISRIVAQRVTDTVCNLLFIGLDWHRKGGEIVLEVLKRLLNRGIKIQLTIVGCQPDLPIEIEPFVNRIGFINFNIESDAKRMAQIFQATHFFLFPSQMDFSPHVINEASSFGVPVLTTNVGGIPSLISEAENGFIFDLHEIDGYVDVIEKYFTKKLAYKDLALKSFDYYYKNLTWDASIETLISEMRVLCK